MKAVAMKGSDFKEARTSRMLKVFQGLEEEETRWRKRRRTPKMGKRKERESFQRGERAKSGSSITLMASVPMKFGALVSLQDLYPSSPFFKEGASLRIVGRLYEYNVEKSLGIVIDGDAILKVSTQHLRDLNFQVGSFYQFIGELLIQPDNEGILQARISRNVDGIDLNLYHQALLLVRQFQADLPNNPTTQ